MVLQSWLLAGGEPDEVLSDMIAILHLMPGHELDISTAAIEEFRENRMPAMMHATVFTRAASRRFLGRKVSLLYLIYGEHIVQKPC